MICHCITSPHILKLQTKRFCHIIFNLYYVSVHTVYINLILLYNTIMIINIITA